MVLAATSINEDVMEKVEVGAILSDGLDDVDGCFAIYIFSLRLVFYFAWMDKKSCASKP